MNMFTYDIITDVNNNKFALIRFANDNDDKIDTFSNTEETLKHVNDIIKNVPDNITIVYDFDVVEYFFS